MSSVRGSVAAVLLAVAGCGGSSEGGGGAQPPSISAGPAGASVLTGESATFSVAASGGGALAYQWYRDDVAIPGATGASYTAPAATWRDAGARFTVTVANAAGSVRSAPAELQLRRSASQQIDEDLLTSGSHELRWNLERAGPQASGVNYLFSDAARLAASPLTAGPQLLTQSAPANMGGSLALVTPGPTRVIVDGAVLVVPATQGAHRVSYVGEDVQVDHLAADGATVAYSERRSGYAWKPLAGAVAGSPAELAHAYDALFANPALLDGAATYPAGAGYARFTGTTQGDRYDAFDCHAATTGADVSPCLTGTTLSAALNAGIASASDGVTYRLADGALRTVGGIEIWVATAPRPQLASHSATLQYRTYWQAGGNVYTGRYIPAGTVIGGGSWVSNPSGATEADQLSYLDYSVRLNQDARDGIAAAVKPLSAAQQAFEALALGGGLHGLHWNLEATGPQASGTNYLFTDSVRLAASPSTAGPQLATESAPVNATASLALGALAPTRVIKDGAVLVVPGTQQATRVSYAGAEVQVEYLAADGMTVAYGVVESGHTHRSLAGAVAGSPAELAHWYGSVFSNPAVLDPAATYRPGAAYVRFTVTSQADRYDAFDCYAATTGPDVSPCLTGTTLLAALTAGIASASDGVTYHLADGALRTAGGFDMWVASAPRPDIASKSSTRQYRIYWQSGGNVYTGRFIPAGTVLGGSSYVSNPSGATPADQLTFLPYGIRLNQAARDGIVAALAI